MIDVLVAACPPQATDTLAPWLHASERDGLRHHVDPADRDRSLTGRALLRALVARVTGREPAAIRFGSRCVVCGQDGHGRPRIEPDGAPFTSVAHAGAVVVAAVAAVPLGVDVEHRTAVGFAGFDDVALTPGERAGIAALPEPARPDARTAIWVRKEALLKRHEVGLSVDPRGVEIGLDGPGRLRDDPLAPGTPLALVDLAVEAGYRAALAVAADELPRITMLGAAGPWAAPGGRSRRSSG